MSDPRDYNIDLSGSTSESPTSPRPPRPFISVHFACCSIYHRIYRNPTATAYDGKCPKCAKAVHFAISPGGTDCRAFVVH